MPDSERQDAARDRMFRTDVYYRCPAAWLHYQPKIAT